MPLGHKGSECICVYNVCIRLHLQTNIYAHTFVLCEGTGFVYSPSLLLRDRRDELASSGWNSSSSHWPTGCSASPNMSFSLTSPEACAHLDSCHAKTGLSQNHTPSVFPGIGVSVKSLFPIPRCKTRTSGGFYLQIDLIRIPVSLFA